jgi:hypothetical protein
MKAFIMGVAAMIAISAVSALVLNKNEMSAQDVYVEKGNVRR